MAANYTFGDAQGLFRFYGDMNGDRRVDISDFGFFSLAYLTPAELQPRPRFQQRRPDRHRRLRPVQRAVLYDAAVTDKMGSCRSAIASEAQVIVDLRN